MALALMKEVWKQPLVPVTPLETDTPVTVKLQVRFNAGFAHKLPAATVIKLASKYTRFIRASDTFLRLRIVVNGSV